PFAVTYLMSDSSLFVLHSPPQPPHLHPFPTRRSSDLDGCIGKQHDVDVQHGFPSYRDRTCDDNKEASPGNSTMMNEELPEPKMRSEEHTSELQSRFDLVCRLLLEKKNTD